MKGVMGMFGGMCKNVWVLQLSFFINEKVAGKSVPRFPCFMLLPCPSNSFRKNFMAPPINFSFLFKAYL